MKSTVLAAGLSLLALTVFAQQSTDFDYDRNNPFALTDDGRICDPVNQRFMELADNAVKLYPSPALGDVYVQYALHERSNVMIDLFTRKGRHLGMLENRQLCAGSHEVVLPTARLRPGKYYVHIQIGNCVAVREVEILRL